jgi:hypothetical protein
MVVEDHYQQVLEMLLPVGPIKHHRSHRELIDAIAERGLMARFRAIKPVPVRRPVAATAQRPVFL